MNKLTGQTALSLVLKQTGYIYMCVCVCVCVCLFVCVCVCLTHFYLYFKIFSALCILIFHTGREPLNSG